jgi:hypothetical protein
VEYTRNIIQIPHLPEQVVLVVEIHLVVMDTQMLPTTVAAEVVVVLELVVVILDTVLLELYGVAAQAQEHSLLPM